MLIKCNLSTYLTTLTSEITSILSLKRNFELSYFFQFSTRSKLNLKWSVTTSENSQCPTNLFVSVVPESVPLTLPVSSRSSKRKPLLLHFHCNKNYKEELSVCLRKKSTHLVLCSQNLILFKFQISLTSRLSNANKQF